MNPSTPWLRDQLMAAMREAGVLPPSTDELAAKLPPESVAQPCRGDWRCHRSPNPYITDFACDGEVHTYNRKRHGAEVYPHLRALERKGLCKRFYVEGHRAVYWMALDPGAEASSEVAALEQMWAMS